MTTENAPAPIRILIADDHDIVREGLAAILDIQPDILLVAEATNGLEAIAKARQHQPDVILLDMMMPQLDGLAAIPQIKQVHPEAHILVLTSFADDDRVFPAIKAGALGYLLKDTPRQQLLQAIREVAQGQAYLHPVIAMKMMRELNNPTDKSSSNTSLTDRERDVLQRIAQGLTNQEIATDLVIHERTVAKYVSIILQKLHLTNRTQAALYALRLGIATLD